MKRQWMTMAFAAAVMTVTAMGQGMKATIPFDFTAGGKQMAAGDYIVSDERIGSANSAVTLRNRAAKQAVLLMANVNLNGEQGQQPKLVFKCYSGACALAQVQDPSGISRVFPTPTPRNGQKERAVIIRLSSSSDAAGF